MTVPLLTEYREYLSVGLTHDQAVTHLERRGIPRDSVDTALRRCDQELRAQARPGREGRDLFYRQRALWALVRRLQDADLLPPVLDRGQQAAVRGLVLEAVCDLIDGERRNATAAAGSGS